jgi:peptidoglycan DL-endopeptidase CwlO
MTAPTMIGDLTSIPSRIASITAQLSAVFVPPSPGTSASFASQLSSASATGNAATSEVTSSGVTSAGPTGSDVVADAQQYLGIPYVYAGESTSGMDCSGLTQKTFRDLGITLPRTAAEQQKVGTPVASLAQAQPGDLLFFGNPAYHVAIYAGDNKLIESPEPGKTVHEIPIYQQPTSISRIVNGTGSSSLPSTGTGMTASQITAAGLNPAVARFASQFAAAESQFHLPTGMLAAVAQQESGGNTQAVSSAGAQGLMQLMPSTAAGIGVDAFDPNQAITAAARILGRNLTEFGGSVPLALAAYNAGAGAVKQYGGIPPYSQTQNYVKSITAMMARER